tara:strand:+ start:646 stop:927 length:282 start_codon:yes stop_codon:yes gene_type:complete
MIIIKKKDYYYNKTFILQGVIYKKLNNKKTYLKYINNLISTKFIEISYDKDKDVKDISMDDISVPIISSILFYRHNLDLLYCEIEELIIRTKI